MDVSNKSRSEDKGSKFKEREEKEAEGRQVLIRHAQ